MLDELLTAAEAAAHIHVTEASLRTMRCRGKGPPCERKGWAVLYRRADLDAYRAQRDRGRTATNRCDP